jgi:hypothetical protein
MKKRENIIFIMIVFVILLCGCSSSKDNDNNLLGLKLKVSDVTDSGLKLTCTQSNKDLNGEIKADLKYYIEKYDDNSWTELEYISSVHWDETSIFTIPQNGEYYWTLYWPFYGNLSKGDYRVKKIFNYENKEYVYYAEFEIN